MKCPRCQFENPKRMKFCVECGNKLETKCPKCGFSNSPSFKFCGECGHRLIESPEEISSIKYSEPQSYTPQFLADKILTTRSSIEGERKLVTVMFADVANYTSMAEKLDPEEVHQIMDGCFRILMDEIHNYEGTINQFTGDGVMALFGAPISHEDHAQRACQAALAIQKAVNRYAKKIEKDCNIEFKLRIGLNSGPVIVGAIGDDLRMDYTAVGDTTNLAMRMESIAEPGNIQISEKTYSMIKAYFDCKDLGLVSVKGKKEPQQTYKLIKSSEVQTRFEAAVSKGLVRFIGRQNSMAAIQNAWDKVTNGSGQVLGVVGEAGVGKSRLLLEFRKALTNGGFNYLEGRCLHYGGSMAYLPFLDIIKAFFGIEEDQREYIINKNIKDKLIALDRELLKDSRPAFQDLLSLKVEEESWRKLEPKTKRERTFEALRNLFITLSEEKPLIIAVEDLHWMDKTSEEFINYFIDCMPHSPILLILLYRSEYTHQWGSKSYYSKIGLNQLTMDSSAELVSAILEGGKVATELRDLILNRSAGNPLFMEEFTHTLLENGSIKRKNNQFVLSRNLDDIQVPETIQGIIAARMDRLEENLKRTMQVASVIGRDFAFRILQTITGMREELKSYLLNLQGLEFIYEKNLFPELEYIFKHALTQEVAYNSLLHARRQEIHEKIGKAIEKLYSDRLEELCEVLAYHYSKTTKYAKAYHYYKLSGEKAFAKYSHWEAFQACKEAIRALNQMPESRETQKAQVEIRSFIFAPMRLLSYPEGSLDILKEGAIFAKEIRDTQNLINFYSTIGKYYAFKGEPLKERKYQEDCLQNALKINDIDVMAPLCDDLFSSYGVTGEYYKITELAPAVIELLEESKRESEFFDRTSCVYSNISMAHGLGLGFMGKFMEGENYISKALNYAHKTNHLYSIALVENGATYFFNLKGEGTRAIRHSKIAINYFEQTKALTWLSTAFAGLGFGYILEEKFDNARKYLKKGLSIHKDIGIPVFIANFYIGLGEIDYYVGGLDRAQKKFSKAVELSQKIGDRLAEGISWSWLGRILGRIEPQQIFKAEECITNGIKVLGELKANPYIAQAYLFDSELYIDRAKKEKGLEKLEEAAKMFREMGMDYWLGKAQEVLAAL